MEAECERISERLRACKTVQQLRDVWIGENQAIQAVKKARPAYGINLVNLKEYLKPRLINDPAMQAPQEAAE